MSRANRERIRAALFLGLSFAAALIAALLTWISVAEMVREIETIQGSDPQVKVLVAAHTIPQGHTINGADLRLMELPNEYVTSTAILDPSRLIDRVAQETILVGEMFREERVASRENGTSIAAIIPTGMRALSVNISGGAAVSGFVEPGNHVDVLVTTDASADGAAQTTTLLQAIRVIAVDDRVGAGSRPDGTRHRPAVTLLLSPDQAEQLTHAVAHGRVSLVLRSAVDLLRIPSNGADLQELLGTEESRMEIPEYRARRSEAADGGVLYIRGQHEGRE